MRKNYLDNCGLPVVQEIILRPKLAPCTALGPGTTFFWVLHTKITAKFRSAVHIYAAVDELLVRWLQNYQHLVL